jgi:hypothetical protein
MYYIKRCQSKYQTITTTKTSNLCDMAWLNVANQHIIQIIISRVFKTCIHFVCNTHICIKINGVAICEFCICDKIISWLFTSFILVWFMVFNTTFNNFTVISWSVLLVEEIRVITKLANSEQSAKGKVKTHKYINRQNQSTTGKLWKP